MNAVTSYRPNQYRRGRKLIPTARIFSSRLRRRQNREIGTVRFVGTRNSRCEVKSAESGRAFPRREPETHVTGSRLGEPLGPRPFGFRGFASVALDALESLRCEIWRRNTRIDLDCFLIPPNHHPPSPDTSRRCSSSAFLIYRTQKGIGLGCFQEHLSGFNPSAFA